MNRAEHWETVYRTNAPDSVSWFESMPETSLELVESCALDRAAGIIDVGGGASYLVDGLLARGHTDLSVLDVSSEALRTVKMRLGERAARVTWMVGDVTTWRPERKFDLWHDRAVLHFLGSEDDRGAYLEVLVGCVSKGGWVILATFGPEGPTRCSGIDVTRYSDEDLSALLGEGFSLERSFTRIHTTPSAADQQFQWTVFRRV